MKVLRHLKEGFDLVRDPKYLNSTYVRITDLHQDGLDISLENNPVCYDLPVRIHHNNKIIKIPVISVFKRKPYPKSMNNDLDRNPVLYALKKENGYSFESDKDKKLLIERFKEILRKTFSEEEGTVYIPNMRSIINPQTGIAVPSNNELQSIIVDAVEETLPNLEVLRGLLRKLTIEEIQRVCCHPNSLFRKYWKRQGANIDEIANLQDELWEVLENMPNGIFKRHYLPNHFRKSVLKTMELCGNLAGYQDCINGKDLLILDDTLTYGHSLEETINIILDQYTPKSITVLTLFSKKFND